MLVTVLLQNTTSLKEFFRGVRQRKIVLLQDVVVHEQAMRHHFLRNRDELTVNRIRLFHHITQVRCAIESRKISEIALRTKLDDGVRIQHIQIVLIALRALKTHLIVGFILITVCRIGVIRHFQPEFIFCHRNRPIARCARSVLSISFDLLHRTEEVDYACILTRILLRQILLVIIRASR